MKDIQEFLKPFIDCFWFRVDIIPNGCWIWKGCKDKNGYGKINWWYEIDGKIVNKKDRMTHKIAFEIWNNIIIPEHLCCLHKCDNPPCCNPDHLFLGTKKDNMDDKVSKNRQSVGIENGGGKLTREQCLDMIEKYKTGKFTQRELGDMNNCHQSHVCDIVNHKKRVHLNTLEKEVD